MLLSRFIGQLKQSMNEPSVPYKACFKKVWSQIGACLKLFPSQIVWKQASSQAGAGLKDFPIQICCKKNINYRLEMVWNTFPPNPLQKGLVAFWNWSDALSHTNPCGKVNLSTVLPLINALQKGWITGSNWSEAISLARALPRNLITCWLWSGAHSLRTLCKRAWLQTGAGLTHFP